MGFGGFGLLGFGRERGTGKGKELRDKAQRRPQDDLGYEEADKAKILWSFAQFTKGQFRAITDNAYDTLTASIDEEKWNNFSDQEKQTFIKELTKAAFERIKGSAGIDALFKRAAVMVATQDSCFSSKAS